MPEYPQHHLPQIPLVKPTPSFKQLSRCIFLTRFVLRPSFPPVSAGVIAFKLLLLLKLSTTVGRETREDEDWLDTEFFENAQVGLDALGQCEGKTASSGQEGLPGRWALGEDVQVV